MTTCRIYYCSGGGKESSDDKAPKSDSNKDKKTNITKK